MMQGNGMVLNGAWETPSPIHKRWGVVGAEATIFLLEMYLVMRLLYTPRVNRANLAVFGVVAMLICIPLADLIESNINNPNVTPKMNHYSLLSPLGMIIQADEPEPPRLWVGLLGQSVILAGMGSLYILVWGRRRRRMRKGDGSLVGVVTQVDPSE
jgi:hypothetical protein